MGRQYEGFQYRRNSCDELTAADKFSKHPVRYEVFKCKISRAYINSMKEYLSEQCHCKIRHTYKDGYTTFLSSKISKRKVIRYIFDNLQELTEKYDISETYMDLSSLVSP